MLISVGISLMDYSTAMSYERIQEKIEIELAVYFGVELTVIQVGYFFQSNCDSARLLNEIFGFKLYKNGKGDTTYAGFPCFAIETLQAIRELDIPWAIVEQEKNEGRRIIRRVTESSVESAVGHLVGNI